MPLSPAAASASRCRRSRWPTPTRSTVSALSYWLPATGASAARLYWESIAAVDSVLAGTDPDPIDFPVACSVFPGELQRSSRRWAERRFADVRYWGEPPRGGHFAAWEQPQLFAAEVRAAFRALAPRG